MESPAPQQEVRRGTKAPELSDGSSPLPLTGMTGVAVSAGYSKPNQHMSRIPPPPPPSVSSQVDPITRGGGMIRERERERKITSQVGQYEYSRREVVKRWTRSAGNQRPLS